MELDTQRIDDAGWPCCCWACMRVTAYWKSFDWDALGRLHEQGHISNPVGSAKSMVLTPQGNTKAQALLLSMFGKQG